MANKEIPFYNIGSAVGPGCPNRRTDVMLVQFFLRQIYSHPLKINKPAGSLLPITGACDGTTASWILHYQKDLNGQGKSIHADGRVDPARGAQGSRSSITQTKYTISFMNYGHCARYRQEHNHLEKHPLIPPELKTELAIDEPKIGT